MGPNAPRLAAGDAKYKLFSDSQHAPLHSDLEDPALSSASISSRGALRAHGPRVAALFGAAALCAAAGCFKLAWVTVERGVDEEGAVLRDKPIAMIELSALYPTTEELPPEDEPYSGGGGWINRGVTGNITNLLPWHLRERHLADVNCRERLDRFKSFGANPLTAGQPDPLFPAAATSIAPAGANCGDTAQGISESCDKYNKWETFQAVALRGGKPFVVLGPQGVKWKDVGQGELGNCYFLAALSSVAFSHPYVINDMFIKRDKWEQNIFTTRWLLNGHVTEVEVDNNVPSNPEGSTFFTQISRTGEWWPVILEKAWSKIFGSYKATEAGQWTNPVLAMTGAPVMRRAHNKVSDDDLWKELQEATQKGWPMGAGTGPESNCKKYKIPDTHAYSVFRAFEEPAYGKVIEVYNPHGRDTWIGAVPNLDQTDGIFNATLTEYKEAFDSTTVGKVHDASFKITTKLVQTENFKASSWEFNIASAGEFYVSIVWPSARMLEPCKQVKTPAVTVVVARKDSPGEMAPSLTEIGVNSAPVLVTKGAGDYVVSEVLAFPAPDKVFEAHVVIYAPQEVTLTQSANNPDEALMTLLAPSQGGKPCTVVFLEHRGLFVLKMDDKINGLPTFWSHEGNEFMYWVPKEEKWLMIGKDKLQEVKDGTWWSFAKYQKAQMTCGCMDAPNGVGGFNGLFCNEVKPPNVKFGNVQCDAAAAGNEYSGRAQSYCPKTCNVPVCKNPTAPAPPPAPAPTPAPAAPAAPAAGGCTDQENPGIQVNGVALKCPDLAKHCQAYPVVRDKCCATCANQGGVSNNACEDKKPPGIEDGSGNSPEDCSSFKDKCSVPGVLDRCCATCKAANPLS